MWFPGDVYISSQREAAGYRSHEDVRLPIRNHQRYWPDTCSELGERAWLSMSTYRNGDKEDEVNTNYIEVIDAHIATGNRSNRLASSESNECHDHHFLQVIDVDIAPVNHGNPLRLSSDESSERQCLHYIKVINKDIASVNMANQRQLAPDDFHERQGPHCKTIRNKCSNVVD